MKELSVRGMIPPLVVPFTEENQLDEEAFRREVRYLTSKEIDGISSGGSTGEGAVLSNAELARCLEIVMEEKPSQMPLVAGIIRNSTADAIRAAKDARRIGAELLLVTPVSYYGATDAGNFEFYRGIAKAVGLQIVIYNVVQSNLVSPELFVKLLEIDEVVGIKQVDPVKLTEMRVLSEGTGASIFSAADHLLYGTYVSGACGAISALVTVAPELCVRQWRAFQAGDQATGMQLHDQLAPIVRTYLRPPFPGKVKELLNLQGREVGRARSPNTMPTDAERSVMIEALSSAGLRRE